MVSTRRLRTSPPPPDDTPSAKRNKNVNDDRTDGACGSDMLNVIVQPLATNDTSVRVTNASSTDATANSIAAVTATNDVGDKSYASNIPAATDGANDTAAPQAEAHSTDNVSAPVPHPSDAVVHLPTCATATAGIDSRPAHVDEAGNPSLMSVAPATPVVHRNHAAVVAVDPSNMRPWLNIDLMKRIKVALTYHNIPSNIHSPSTLPLHELKWGTNTSPQNHNDEYLCFAGTPVKLWVTGELAILFFRSKRGEINKLGGVAVEPFRQMDYDIIKRTNAIYDNRTSPATFDDQGLVWASTWAATDVHDKPYAFTDIYDARERIANKTTMAHVDMDHLNVSDVVVMETHIQRIRVKSDNTTSDRSREWRKWQVRHQLLAIYRMLPVSKTFKQQFDRGDDTVDV
ncbi:hypothetical protein BXZ70DRAFT_1007170 [Cristinia sonorae]|uniref:Uncharacterized protein n=1 Tax=Cristinia sonorae TaxID=1940300 RepID=A0A8K0XR19_9AGAR|nr:hypothetical protein BXZ70DRAFT_1007170 [Cristinia sonorae]